MCCCPSFLFFFSLSLSSIELSGFNQSEARFVELDEQIPEHVERSVLDPEHSFVAVRQTARTRFAKVRPVKNELSSPNFFQVRRTPRIRFANGLKHAQAGNMGYYSVALAVFRIDVKLEGLYPLPA